MREMNRRRLLAAAGAATGAALVAGCLTGPSGDDEPQPTETPASTPAGSLETACPEYDRVDRVVCYDGIDPESVDAYLEPDPRTATADEPIEFTLYNGSERTLQTNFYNWLVHKRVDGEWYHVAPRGSNDPLMTVQPGGSHTWTLTVDNDGIEDGAPVPRSGGENSITVGGFGGGTYAFRSRGWFEGEDHGQAIAFATTFEFDGDQLALTPTDAIEETAWEGETLVAQSSRGRRGDSSRLGAFELRRVEDPGATPTQLITEQVLRRHRLRDAIALSRERDAEAVRLEEYSSTRPIFGSRSDRIYEYEGRYYEVTTRELDDGDG
ncbi:hypothetical protein HWV07_08340 [Natronomonas salina]|uniref:hypothetical protein n=1 Tax=Natronomonas salina TaxID=1710540 RepID=UPI0015B6AC5C|nr:hypothetical protein [Natronomonas salina]QLD89041.1 hypothetical protein HWV07_08340 [Natronomonas salina]